MNLLNYLLHKGHPVDVIWFFAGGALLLLFIVVFAQTLIRPKKRKDSN